MRWVLVFLVLPINILCQDYDTQIQKHIKPDFYILSELLTSNGGCKFLNKDSTSFLIILIKLNIFLTIIS